MWRKISRISSHVLCDTLPNLNLYYKCGVFAFGYSNFDRPFVRITITVYLSAARTHSNLLAENSIKMQDWFAKGTQIKLAKIETINMKLMKRMEFPRTGVFHGNRTRLLFVSFFFQRTQNKQSWRNRICSVFYPKKRYFLRILYNI